MINNVNIAQGGVEPRRNAAPARVSVERPAAVQEYSAIESNPPAVSSVGSSVSVDVPRVDTQASPPRAPVSVSSVVSEANDNFKLINADLAIEVDRELKQVIFKVVDTQTGETIKQIPSKEMIRVAKQLKHMAENYANNNGGGGLQLFLDSDSFA